MAEDFHDFGGKKLIFLDESPPPLQKRCYVPAYFKKKCAHSPLHIFCHGITEHIRRLFDMYCVLYDTRISKAFDSILYPFKFFSAV